MIVGAAAAMSDYCGSVRIYSRLFIHSMLLTTGQNSGGGENAVEGRTRRSRDSCGGERKTRFVSKNVLEENIKK